MNISDINVPPGKRGMLIGTTESGKSTLAQYLINDWAENYPEARILVVDTKPHFKATHNLTGIPIQFTRLYWSMRKGDTLPYSLRLPVGDGITPYRLKNAWDLARTFTPKNRGLILIAQTNRVRDYYWLNRVIMTHYETVSKWTWNYTYVDEMMVFLHQRSMHTGVYQTIVSGAELGIGFLGATQRPKWIPTEAISEMSKLYMFIMYYWEDIKHLRDMGVPPTFEIPDEYYVFNYFDKRSGKHQKMMLDLPSSPSKERTA